MSASALRTETYLWLARRLSALILTICITVHIATMIIAVQGGLSSEEIIARIGGSKIWLGFYLVFVTCFLFFYQQQLRIRISEIPTSNCTFKL